MSRDVSWPPNPIERRGRWEGSGKARRVSGRGSENAVQLHPALTL